MKKKIQNKTNIPQESLINPPIGGPINQPKPTEKVYLDTECSILVTKEGIVTQVIEIPTPKNN